MLRGVSTAKKKVWMQTRKAHLAASLLDESWTWEGMAKCEGIEIHEGGIPK